MDVCSTNVQEQVWQTVIHNQKHRHARSSKRDEEHVQDQPQRVASILARAV